MAKIIFGIPIVNLFRKSMPRLVHGHNTINFDSIMFAIHQTKLNIISYKTQSYKHPRSVCCERVQKLSKSDAIMSITPQPVDSTSSSVDPRYSEASFVPVILEYPVRSE